MLVSRTHSRQVHRRLHCCHPSAEHLIGDPAPAAFPRAYEEMDTRDLAFWYAEPLVHAPLPLGRSARRDVAFTETEVSVRVCVLLDVVQRVLDAPYLGAMGHVSQRGGPGNDRSSAIGVSTVDHRDDLDDETTFEDPVEDAVLASPC